MHVSSEIAAFETGVNNIILKWLFYYFVDGFFADNRTCRRRSTLVRSCQHFRHSTIAFSSTFRQQHFDRYEYSPVGATSTLPATGIPPLTNQTELDSFRRPWASSRSQPNPRYQRRRNSFRLGGRCKEIDF